METKRLKFDYEDTDKSIEIDLYGLVFEINNLNNIEELEDLDRENINLIEAQIEKILGTGSIKKINDKRRKDGYKELDLDIELSILGCIFESYAKAMSDNTFGRVANAVEDIEKEADEFNKGMNRGQRRDYNRYNRGYGKSRRNRNYRRY